VIPEETVTMVKKEKSVYLEQRLEEFVSSLTTKNYDLIFNRRESLALQEFKDHLEKLVSEKSFVLSRSLC
jgi:hypothetical protein